MINQIIHLEIPMNDAEHPSRLFKVRNRLRSFPKVGHHLPRALDITNGLTLLAPRPSGCGDGGRCLRGGDFEQGVHLPREERRCVGWRRECFRKAEGFGGDGGEEGEGVNCCHPAAKRVSQETWERGRTYIFRRSSGSGMTFNLTSSKIRPWT